MGKTDNNDSKNQYKKKNRKGKHVREEVKATKAIEKYDGVNKIEKKLTIFTNFLFKIIILFIILGIILLGIYYFKPEKSNDIIDNSKAISKYNDELRDKFDEDSSLMNNSVANLKFITKKYKGNNYNISTGFFEKEYDIIYFSFANDTNKINKLIKNSVLSYEQYLEYCKSNNIKAKYNDSNKKYSIFSSFNAGCENIDVFICDRQVENDTEIMYLSKECSNSNPGNVVGFVIIYPSSQINTTTTEIREVISESDYYHLSGEKMKITNTPIDKDVLFTKSIVLTEDEKVNYVLNKMLDNICHKDTIHYSYAHDLPEPESVDAKLNLNTCVQFVEKKNNKKTTTKYTIYGDYEAVDFDEKGFVSNAWTYKDEIIKKFLKAESVSNQSYFDFKLDEDEEYYIIKAYVAKQNLVIEGKVSREEEFFYIDKNTFELKKMYCHNYISRYTVQFDYSSDTINVPDDIL